MLLRRGHLYLGLFLFPWAILYGVTAFLFNHPTVFSDQPTTNFGRSALLGTPLETLPNVDAIAAEVVRKLNELHKPETPYQLAGSAKYGREFAFATIQAEGQNLSFLMDLKHGTGTIRSTPKRESKPEPVRAPFAVGSGPAPPRGKTANNPRPEPKQPARSDGIKLDNPIHENLKASIPAILASAGWPTGDVTVTSVPDIVFPIEAHGSVWTASYNAMTGSVSGTPADAKPETELSWRRFLLRLHLAHGYPNDTNARWGWAVIVDAMAFTMCFWGLSGLFMWWQIKSTRLIGGVVLLVSALAAAGLGWAMHTTLTGG